MLKEKSKPQIYTEDQKIYGNLQLNLSQSALKKSRKFGTKLRKGVTMNLPILVVRHHIEETLGSWENVFLREGVPFTYRDVYRGEILPGRLEAYRGIIVLGGFMGVYEQDSYPFLKDELKWLETVVKAEKPLVGICLGSQLIARVLGAGVYKGYSGPEIGWKPVTLTAQGKADPLFKGFPPSFTPVHWHGDTFDLPIGATLLASSDMYPHQAFCYGDFTLAIQFHVEATGKLIRFWLRESESRLKKRIEEKEKILRETTKHLPELNRLSEKLWSNVENNLFKNE